MGFKVLNINIESFSESAGLNYSVLNLDVELREDKQDMLAHLRRLVSYTSEYGFSPFVIKQNLRKHF